MSLRTPTPVTITPTNPGGITNMKRNSRLRHFMRLKAWELYADGLSIRQVAEVLHLSVTKTHTIIKAITQEMRSNEGQQMDIHTEFIASYTLHRAVMALCMDLARREGIDPMVKVTSARLALECRRYIDDLVDTANINLHRVDNIPPYKQPNAYNRQTGTPIDKRQANYSRQNVGMNTSKDHLKGYGENVTTRSAAGRTEGPR